MLKNRFIFYVLISWIFISQLSLFVAAKPMSPSVLTLPDGSQPPSILVHRLISFQNAVSEQNNSLLAIFFTKEYVNEFLRMNNNWNASSPDLWAGALLLYAVTGTYDTKYSLKNIKGISFTKIDHFNGEDFILNVELLIKDGKTKKGNLYIKAGSFLFYSALG